MRNSAKETIWSRQNETTGPEMLSLLWFICDFSKLVWKALAYQESRKQNDLCAVDVALNAWTSWMCVCMCERGTQNRIAHTQIVILLLEFMMFFLYHHFIYSHEETQICFRRLFLLIAYGILYVYLTALYRYTPVNTPNIVHILVFSTPSAFVQRQFHVIKLKSFCKWFSVIDTDGTHIILLLSLFAAHYAIPTSKRKFLLWL